MGWLKDHLIKKPKQRPHSLRAVYIAFCIEFLIAFWVGHMVSQTPAVKAAGRSALEAFQVVQDPELGKHVVIVRITRDDHEKYFDARSPLDPDALSRLLNAVACMNPKLIAVDVDTSHRDFRRSVDCINCPRGPTLPVVWGRGWICAEEDCAGGVLAPEPVLGRLSGFEKTSHFGLAAYKRDADGAVREFRRCFAVPSADGSARHPSFHWAIVNLLNGPGETACAPGSGKEEPIVIPRLNYQFPVFDAGGFLEARPVGQALNRSLFEDKVVIVGGAYDFGDRHLTAVGEVHGYETIARAVEAEMGDGVVQPNELLAFGLDVALAIVVKFVDSYFVYVFAGILTGGIMAVTPLIGSFIAFTWFGYWFDALPFLLGFWFMQVYFSKPLTAFLERRLPHDSESTTKDVLSAQAPEPPS